MSTLATSASSPRRLEPAIVLCRSMLYFTAAASSFSPVSLSSAATNGPPQAVVNAIQIVQSVGSSSASVWLTRGPYLQLRTPTSMIVRWRTSRLADTRLRYGLSPTALTLTNDNPLLTTEHLVQLSNHQPDTRYYYAVGTTETNLAGGSDYYFRTAPTNGSQTRIWFVSDYGFKDSGEASVRTWMTRIAVNIVRQHLRRPERSRRRSKRDRAASRRRFRSGAA